jgi:hypothetical protein
MKLLKLNARYLSSDVFNSAPKSMSFQAMASNKDQKQGVNLVLCIAKRVNHSKLGRQRMEKPKKALPLHGHLITDFSLHIHLNDERSNKTRMRHCAVKAIKTNGLL